VTTGEKSFVPPQALSRQEIANAVAGLRNAKGLEKIMLRF
jgi:hypothetical protein